MCLILFSLNQNPNYQLILAGNRDEFYQRQTAPADFWTDHPDVLGGRDLEAMGTWLGITRQGRISFITNFRDPQHINPAAPSRGHLVTDYLLGKDQPDIYLEELAQKAKAYNGFNLVTGTSDDLWYFSNHQNKVRKVGDGIHALSNHLLETPWPKVVRIKERMSKLISQEKVEPRLLLDALYDGTLAPDQELPETGVGLERERALSAIFIKSPGYGSRCSTVLLIDRKNRVRFHERTYDLTTFEFQEKVFEFTLGMNNSSRM